MASVFTKSKASTLAKLAALPRFRSPKDLLNEPHLPYDLQISQIKGTADMKEGKYMSSHHYDLCQKTSQLRQAYK